MRIAIFSRNNIDCLGSITGILDDKGIEYVLNPCHIGGVDIAVSVGGDGTFLWTVKLLGLADIPVLGINLGRLGFLAGVAKDAVNEAIDSLVESRYDIEERSLLYAEGDFDESVDFPYALNEFSVQKQDKSMIAVDVSVDGSPVATYWADGVLLSTPTGSTAYSLSIGGPIIAPECECFVISPIAPHNLGMRPLVVPSGSEVKFQVKTRSGTALTTLDNREYTVGDMASFTVRAAGHRVRMIRMHGSSFFKTLQNKLMWGQDLRN